MFGSKEFTVTGYKKSVKNGAVNCYLAINAKHNDYNADFIGTEASTFKMNDAAMFDAIISYPLGTTLYGVITRNNYQLQVVGFDKDATDEALKKGGK